MCQLPGMVLVRVTGSTAVQMGKGCRLCFSGGDGAWSDRLQRRQEMKTVLKGSAVDVAWGNYKLQYGEGDLFETVLTNGSTLHTCI